VRGKPSSLSLIILFLSGEEDGLDDGDDDMPTVLFLLFSSLLPLARDDPLAINYF
jgi:hypothetical protein